MIPLRPRGAGRRRVGLAVATALPLLAGCASIGPPFDADAAAALHVGVDDRDTVRRALGDPHQVSTAAQPCEERWHYAHAVGHAGDGTEGEVAVIAFDTGGRVCDVFVTRIAPGEPYTGSSSAKGFRSTRRTEAAKSAACEPSMRR